MGQEDVRKRMNAHIVAFAVVLTLALVSAGTVLSGGGNRAAVMAIAFVQVLVVLFAMMHALQAGTWVRWTLGFCAFFVAALAGLTYLAFHDTVDGTERIVIAPTEHAADVEMEQ